MSAPQGKGRGKRSVTETSSQRQEDRSRVAALPTRQPRPDWMTNPKLLPKKPPTVKSRSPQ